MDLLSHPHWAKTILTSSFADPPLRFIWTSGRKCNYPGCPPDNPFWFWSSSYVLGESKRIVTKNSDCGYCEWGGRGSLRKPQPDNRFVRGLLDIVIFSLRNLKLVRKHIPMYSNFDREGLLEGREEACLAVLDGLYGDGLTWHDIACHHVKPVICERRKENR